MSNPGDLPRRTSPKSGKDIVKQTIAMPTSAATMEEDSLKNINEMMGDPLQDSLAELFAAAQPDGSSSSAAAGSPDDGDSIRAHLTDAVIAQKREGKLGRQKVNQKKRSW